MILSFYLSFSVLLVNVVHMRCHEDHDDDDEKMDMGNMQAATVETLRNVDSVPKRVILISFDGFRWDYVQKLPYPNNFSLFIEQGTSAPQGITNLFYTKTFPNHYSIVTGLYEESHGIVSNDIFVPSLNKVIHTMTEKKESCPLYNGEPIWVTYAKSRKEGLHEGSQHVGCIMWGGCDCDIGGVNLRRNMLYDKNVTWLRRVQQAIDWIQDDVQLVLIYFHEPDATGHEFGPDSEELKNVLRTLNDYVGHLISELKRTNLLDTTNLVITSDHGMALSGTDTSVQLAADLYKVVVEDDIAWFIEPIVGREAEAIALLNKTAHAVLYRKADLPTHWHYKNSDRIASLILLADPGFILKAANDDLQVHSSLMSDYVKPKPKKGNHGYSPDIREMRPAFFAYGPAFSRNYFLSETFSIVDIYNVLCNVLGITPAPNNGTSINSQRWVLLSTNAANDAGWLSNYYTLTPNFLIVATLSLGVVLFTLAVFVCYQYRNKRYYRVTVAHRYRPLGAADHATSSFVDNLSDFSDEDSDPESMQLPGEVPVTNHTAKTKVFAAV